MLTTTYLYPSSLADIETFANSIGKLIAMTLQVSLCTIEIHFKHTRWGGDGENLAQ